MSARGRRLWTDAEMDVHLSNEQRTLPVYPARIRRLAACAIRKLKLSQKGILAITFVDGRRMRPFNRRVLAHNRATDVITLRYDRGEGFPQLPSAARNQAVIGDVVVCPAFASRYARERGVPYARELARYVLHGILHWKGLKDGTAAEKRRMRSAEERLLRACENG